MKKYFIILAALFSLSVSAKPEEYRYKVGEYHQGKDRIIVSIEVKNGNKTAFIRIYDEHIINSNHFTMSKKDLLELKELIELAIKENPDCDASCYYLNMLKGD